MITLEEKQAYVSKLLTANQAAKLMKEAFYDWVVPPTGIELRVGYGRITPEDSKSTLFFYILEAATNIIASMHERSDSNELLVAVMPDHPEKGVIIIDPSRWGRWDLMIENVKDIWPYRCIGKLPYLQAAPSHCRKRHEVTPLKDITLVYVKDEEDNRFILREELEEE